MSLINLIINKLCHYFYYKYDSSIIFHLFLCHVHFVNCAYATKLKKDESRN